MGDDYKTTVGCETNFHIYGQGSEEFIPQLENQIGFGFSSPPYFNLEDYKIGNQSYKPGVSYEEWKKNYLEPTIKNTYKYLIDDGFFAININNFNNYNDYDLVGDTYEIALSSGFKLVDILPMKNITRCSGHKEWNKGGYGSAEVIAGWGMRPSCDCPGFRLAQYMPCKRMGKFKVFCALLLLHILLFSPQQVL